MLSSSFIFLQKIIYIWFRRFSKSEIQYKNNKNIKYQIISLCVAQFMISSLILIHRFNKWVAAFSNEIAFRHCLMFLTRKWIFQVSSSCTWWANEKSWRHLPVLIFVAHHLYPRLLAFKASINILSLLRCRHLFAYDKCPDVPRKLWEFSLSCNQNQCKYLMFIRSLTTPNEQIFLQLLLFSTFMKINSELFPFLSL